MTQFLGGLWKRNSLQRKRLLVSSSPQANCLRFPSRGSFDRDALHQTVWCLFPWRKQETSDIPLNADDSPLWALAHERWQGLGGWEGCSTARVLELLHWQHMDSLKRERGKQGVQGRWDSHSGFLQVRWDRLRGAISARPPILSFSWLLSSNNKKIL